MQITAQSIRNPLGGSDFDELLIAPLDATVTIAQSKRMSLVPGRRRDDLHLNVAGRVHSRLGEHGGITEAQLRLRRTLAVGSIDLVGVDHLAHSTAATARERFDHDGAVVGGKKCADILDAARPLGRRQHRQPCGNRGGTGRGLISDQLEHIGVGPDEGVTRGRASPGELGVFAEKSITRMNHLRARRLGRGQYPSLIEVCLWTATRQGNRFVSSMHMRTVGVVFGVDRHRVDAEFGCGADDSKRDLTAVRDHQGRAHRLLPELRGRP